MKKLRLNIILGSLIEVIAGIIMAVMYVNNKEIAECATFCFMMGIILSTYNIFDLGYGEKKAEVSLLN